MFYYFHKYASNVYRKVKKTKHENKMFLLFSVFSLSQQQQKDIENMD